MQSADHPPTVTLDRPRALAWTLAARARLDSLPRYARGGAYYRLCCLVWAMLAERDHPFDEPEDLAQHLADANQVQSAGRAILAAQKAAAAPEKNAGGSTPSPSGSSSSGSGRRTSGR